MEGAMRLIVDGFYRLASGQVGRYLGTDGGLRAFSVGGRKVRVRRRKVRGAVSLPVRPEREALPRKIPLKRDAKRPASSKRTQWAAVRPGKAPRVKPGEALNTGGACRCGGCRLG
jgi:hypothetical protein